MGIEQEPLQPAPTTSATGRVTRRGSMEGILVPLAAIVQAELGSAQFSGDRLFAEHSVLCWFILVVQPEVTGPTDPPGLVVMFEPMLKSPMLRPPAIALPRAFAPEPALRNCQFPPALPVPPTGPMNFVPKVSGKPEPIDPSPGHVPLHGKTIGKIGLFQFPTYSSCPVAIAETE